MSKTTFTVDKDKLQVVCSRVFAAPREKIWAMVTDVNQMPQWWGPPDLTMKVDKMDFRVGGEWRFVHTDKNGTEYGFHGVYKIIEPMNRITDTFNFEGIPAGHELVETMTLEDVDDGTKMTTTSQYANIQDLEGMVASGMESGQVASFERLATLIEKQ